ncbi:MAG: hypothetical protein L0G27_08375 [Paracoccus sp. (in: a-proteobacteria)]|nr:hypothetical protein [Paracoccus sp. (in: a-proteobacteria)]
MRTYLTGALLLALSLPAGAQTVTYLDDRSTPQQVIASYYNAIQMRQFARAYSYRLRVVPDEAQDQLDQDYATFRADIAPVTDLRFRVGTGFGDAGAGTIMTALPVVTETTSEDGTVAVQSGCLLVKQVSPDAQDLVPFQPTRITQIGMEDSKDGFDATQMPDCAY